MPTTFSVEKQKAGKHHHQTSGAASWAVGALPGVLWAICPFSLLCRGCWGSWGATWGLGSTRKRLGAAAIFSSTPAAAADVGYLWWGRQDHHIIKVWPSPLFLLWTVYHYICLILISSLHLCSALIHTHATLAPLSQHLLHSILLFYTSAQPSPIPIQPDDPSQPKSTSFSTASLHLCPMSLSCPLTHTYSLHPLHSDLHPKTWPSLSITLTQSIAISFLLLYSSLPTTSPHFLNILTFILLCFSISLNSHYSHLFCTMIHFSHFHTSVSVWMFDACTRTH